MRCDKRHREVYFVPCLTIHRRFLNGSYLRIRFSFVLMGELVADAATQAYAGWKGGECLGDNVRQEPSGLRRSIGHGGGIRKSVLPQ